MKKIIAILLAALLLCVLTAACGDGVSPSPDAPPARRVPDAPSAGNAPDSQGGPDGPYPFPYKGQIIVTGQKAAPVVEALGEPQELFEAPSCAFDGVDRIYYYSGFELYTWPERGEDYIASLSLTDDSVSTDQGVCLGMTLDDVTAAYGDGYEQSQSMYTYKDGKSSLAFVIEDGEVTGILYGYDNLSEN